MSQNSGTSGESRPGSDRRQFLRTAGWAAVPLAAGLAGCSSSSSAATTTGPVTAAGITAATVGLTSRAGGEGPATTTLTGRRRLGSLQVSAIGLGCQTMTGRLYGPVSSRADMIKIIRTAVDQGVTLFDTAEAYGPFESERILGEALQRVRDHVVIETKFGWNIDPDTGQQGPGFNSRPEHVKRAVDGMLSRLRTDRIDMLYQHRVDPDVPIEDVAGAVKDLMDAGKVRHWGLSEPGLQTLRRAHRALPLTAVQNEYNLLWRGPEDEVLALCEQLGIGFVCWAPLAYGFTTGTITPFTRFAPGDYRGMLPRHTPENLTANMPIVQLLNDWAVRKGATPGQISLAWLLAQKPWIVPIPSATRVSHLLENIGAEEVHFTGDELREFTTALSALTIHGERSAPFVGVEAPLP